MTDSHTFRALADENRLLILRLLLRRNCCVRALSRQLDISEAAVSQHLKVLREAGLIIGEKCGYFTHYTVNRAALTALADTLYAMAAAAERSPCTPQHGGCTRAEFEKCRNAGEPQPAETARTAPKHEWKGSINMKIAVTYQNGLIFQHFGHCEMFKFYEVENNQVVSSTVICANDSGHGALAGFLKANGADALICGGIGGGARTALAEAGIELFPGASGSADAAVASLLNGTLIFNPDTVCSHHHGESHTCGSHACGEDKHGCAGNS
ncbi:MAG: metalloregulator ArsR/SmtB family transcription factor [Hominenteromicrobium sp.]